MAGACNPTRPEVAFQARCVHGQHSQAARADSRFAKRAIINCYQPKLHPWQRIGDVVVVVMYETMNGESQARPKKQPQTHPKRRYQPIIATVLRQGTVSFCVGLMSNAGSLDSFPQLGHHLDVKDLLLEVQKQVIT